MTVSEHPPLSHNTQIYYPVYTPHNYPMPAGQLNLPGWERLTVAYPELAVVHAILGICRFGARIRYQGYRDTITIHPNLSSANEYPVTVTAELMEERTKHRLEYHTSLRTLSPHFTASPLSLTDKSDGLKRRIHHLSYPPDTGTSINAGIPEMCGTITTSGIEDAISAIQLYGTECQLLKRDFQSAFRHIPVSPLDVPLLGFHWEGKYYCERFLPFGLRTAPYLFNLFAEIFHWILDKELATRALPATIVHYLDDFLIIFPWGENVIAYSQMFSTLCETVELTIKESKNEEGTVAGFGGVELDTQRMVIRLPSKKLETARTMVHCAIKASSLSLLELQMLTGLLNFAAIVVPLGRTFLRRLLYNMQLHYPDNMRHRRWRISSEARKDLHWWEKVLTLTPERSILKADRQEISLWSDAAGTKGLGASMLNYQNRQPPT